MTETVVDALGREHAARKREKDERRRMSDAVVDLLLERAELRHRLRSVSLAVMMGDGLRAADLAQRAVGYLRSTDV